MVLERALRDTYESEFIDRTLIGTFNDLYNEIIPWLYKIKPSVCYTTVIDSLFDSKWENHIKPPAYKNLTDRQLRLCVIKMIEWTYDKRVLSDDMMKSKIYRVGN